MYPYVGSFDADTINVKYKPLTYVSSAHPVQVIILCQANMSHQTFLLITEGFVKLVG